VTRFLLRLVHVGLRCSGTLSQSTFSRRRERTGRTITAETAVSARIDVGSIAVAADEVHSRCWTGVVVVDL
jgi:hypothetical protein